MSFSLLRLSGFAFWSSAAEYIAGYPGHETTGTIGIWIIVPVLGALPLVEGAFRHGRHTGFVCPLAVAFR